MRFVTLAVVLTVAGRSAPPGPTAAEIMAKVAANQDRAQAARLHFVYDKQIRVDSRYSNGKLACEEITDYQVAPKEKGFDAKEVSYHAKTWHKGQYLETTTDPGGDQDGIDQSIAASFRDDLANTTDSQDGISADLFPLTTKEQKDLEFELDGEESPGGRPAYRIRFRPKQSKDYGWTGEALIDKAELQPVRVYTRLSRKLPMLVRTMLGTDVPGLGFSTQYTRLDKDVWFPSSFGTEFRIRAVFFFKRTLTISMENKNFRRAAVTSEIHYDTAAAP